VSTPLPTPTPLPGRSSAELLRTLAAGTATSTGTEFLRSLVRHVAAALGAEAAFLAEVEEGGWEHGRVLASHTSTGAELPEGTEFLIPGTPCSLAAGQEIVSLPLGTREAFPDDAYVRRNRLDGYLAIVVRGTDGRRLGYLGIAAVGRLEPSDDDLAVLTIFASRAGAEIERRRHEAALRQREAEVAASRTRLVSVADEERRRIGRNLHDGAQQRLVVLGHRIEIARRKLDQGAGEEALEHLAAAADEARAAGTELRELARGLHPAGLTEYGLEPALGGLAQRSHLPLEVLALPDRRLPEVVEVTLYYLVSEALVNAVKYADATRVQVEIVQGRDRVVAEVGDDGVGGADAGSGSGLRGLSERVEALGGTLEVLSPAGDGTRLRATIPFGG
jgi:signal transduction histidine kinase